VTAVSDDFNRANSSSLGANWAELGGVGDWEIVSNKLQCNTDAGALGYYARFETDVGSSDMFAQAVVTSVQASANSNTGVLVRGRSAAVTSYQIDIRHAGDILWFWRIVAGVETQLTNQLGTTSLSVPSASGDTVRGEVAGNLIRAKINGALVGLCKDTNITDGQRAGVNGWNEIASDVVEVDDFAGGGLAADGGLVAPYIVGVSDQVTGTATTLTPTIPSNVAAGDLVLVQTTSRDAAQTMTAPAGEGWSSIQNPSQTGLEDVLWAKVWGLGGQTDDTTPTFGIGSGTAGWGATAVVIRNPSHSTLPWTSVAAAVLASGSGANASSTTVTAPSVTHDGTHRTVVRVVSSADDNALNAPSSGAAAYGGANYDSTTGNDFAQAMSLREDITVTTNTGTSTFTESLVGADVSNGITLVIGIPSGILGLPAETDTARAVAFATKSTTLSGLSSETDSALGLAGASKSRTAGVASETESALGLAFGTKSTTVGVASEAESALALDGASKSSAPLGLPASAESALPLAGQAHATDVAGGQESDTGLPLAGAQKTTTVGTATEVGSALGLGGAVKSTTLGVAGETDAALPLTAATIGTGTETDTVPALAGAAKQTVLGLAVGVEVALPLADQVKITPVGIAVEVDTALGRQVFVGPVPSQGTFDDGRGALIYSSGVDGLVYDPTQALVYDP
jgi:hypothetical protein